MENENTVFKSCGDEHEWIAVMEKCEDTITNETRSNVVDPRYANFRANKLEVIEIFNKFDCNETIDEITHMTALWSKRKYTRYKVDKDVVPDSFVNNLDSVCSNGIHYFKTLEPAFYFSWQFFGHYNPFVDDTGALYDGTYKNWYENGNLKWEVNYKNDECHGPYKTYYKNGNISCEGNYVDGNSHGLWKQWHNNKQLQSESNYKNGKRYGPYKEWYDNGNIACEGNYEDGKRNGLWKWWHDDGFITRKIII